MINIQLGKTYKSEELINSVFTEKETEIAQYSRVDKEIVTANNFAVKLCLSTVFNTNILCIDVFSSSENKAEKNPNIFLQFEGEEKKEWVKINDKVILTNTILDNYCTYAKQSNCWVRASVVKIEEGTFQLKDGNFAIGEYGKYKANLTFISQIPIIQWKDVKREKFNLPKGDISVIRGDFFISRKGTKCFKVKNNGRHLIIRDGWGGAFESYRGGTLPNDQLYYRRASSNGGGTGYDYAVVPVDWVYGLSEEDL